MRKSPLRTAALLLAAALTVGAWGCSSEPSSAPATDKTAAARPVTPPPELLETQEAFVAVSQTVVPAVVNIRAARRSRAASLIPLFEDFFQDLFKHRSRPQREEQSLGSGFFINADGYILTNAHLVEGAEKIRVRLSDQRIFPGRVVGVDTRTDVAVLKIDGAGKLPAVAALGDSDQLRVGQWALAVGNPFGLEGTLTVGVVSATRRTDMGIEEYEDFIQTDASINPGNSGGPLVNIYGQVIGVNTAIVAAGQGIGFAIPINLAHSVAEQLIAKGEVTRGWLGVTVQSLTPDLATSFGLQEPRGVLVNSVLPGSPAARGGLQQGDVLLAVNGRQVEGSGDFRVLIAAIPPGGKAELKLWRNRELTTLSLTLGSPGDSPPPRATATGNSSPLLGISVAPGQSKEGLTITRVDADGPSAAHGIRKGDVLLSLNRREMKHPDDFRAAVKEAETSRNVLLLLRRGDTALYVAFSLPQD
jgi:serine protease Do/serine protease DegQ